MTWRSTESRHQNPCNRTFQLKGKTMTNTEKLLAEMKAARVAYAKHKSTGQQGYGFTPPMTEGHLMLTTPNATKEN